MIGVGEKFPEFELTGVSGNMANLNPDWSDADHDFITVKSWQLKDWSVIYFYPKDFTFICPTEIDSLRFNNLFLSLNISANHPSNLNPNEIGSP